MTTSGPVTQEPNRRLLTHKDYAIEMMESIINDKDVDPCAEQGMEEQGASDLFNLGRVHSFLSFSIYSFLFLIADGCSVLQVLVCMKALQDRDVAKEGVITCLHKRIKNLADEQEQYKGALHTLYQEVKELREKLEEEGCQKKKEQEAKVTVEKELMALLGQVETARADTVAEFKASQPFIDACAVCYGDGFEDFLKQVKSVYPSLDLSKVSMDDPLPSTLAGGTVFEESDDSTKAEVDPKNDSIVLTQPAADQPVISLTLLTNPLNAEDLLAQDVQDIPPKGDENPKDPLAS